MDLICQYGYVPHMSVNTSRTEKNPNNKLNYEQNVDETLISLNYYDMQYNFSYLKKINIVSL